MVPAVAGCSQRLDKHRLFHSRATCSIVAAERAVGARHSPGDSRRAPVRPDGRSDRTLPGGGTPSTPRSHGVPPPPISRTSLVPAASLAGLCPLRGCPRSPISIVLASRPGDIAVAQGPRHVPVVKGSAAA